MRAFGRFAHLHITEVSMNQNHFSLKILTVMLLSAYGGSFADGVVPVSDGNTVSLDTVNVRGSHALSGKTEKTRSYTIDQMSTATLRARIRRSRSASSRAAALTIRRCIRLKRQ